jgi:hypothetical protein
MQAKGSLLRSLPALVFISLHDGGESWPSSCRVIREPDTGVFRDSEIDMSTFSGVVRGSDQSMVPSHTIEEATLLTLKRLGIQAETMLCGIAALAKGETGDMLKLAWELLGLVKGAVSMNPAKVRDAWYVGSWGSGMPEPKCGL